MAPLHRSTVMAGAGCKFCEIAHGKDAETELLYQTETVAVFRDIRPAAPHHYLVVPKEHIRDTRHLNKQHLPLVHELVEAGKHVLEEQGGKVEEARLGFHLPPLLWINHLHLHVIAPESAMGWLHRLSFRCNSYWFVTADWVLNKLKEMPNEKS